MLDKIKVIEGNVGFDIEKKVSEFCKQHQDNVVSIIPISRNFVQIHYRE